MITVHALWFLFIFFGSVISLLCIFSKKFREFTRFRTLHLAALLLNLAILLFLGGCPLTIIELDLRGPSLLGRIPQATIPYIAYRILHFEISSWLSVTVNIALVLIPVAMYIAYRPRKFRRLPSS